MARRWWRAGGVLAAAVMLGALVLGAERSPVHAGGTVTITVRIPVTHYQWGQTGSHREWRQTGARWEWQRSGTQRQQVQVGARWERRAWPVHYPAGGGAWVWTRNGTRHEWRKVAEHLEWRRVRDDQRYEQVGERDVWRLLRYERVYRPNALARAYGQVGSHGEWSVSGRTLQWRAAGSHAEQRYRNQDYAWRIYEQRHDEWIGYPPAAERWTELYFDHRLQETWREIWESNLCWVLYDAYEWWWSLDSINYSATSVADTAPARANAYTYGMTGDYAQVTVEGDYAWVPVFGWQRQAVYDWVVYPVYQWVTVEDWDYIFVPVYQWVWRPYVDWVNVVEEWWEWVPVYGWRETPVYTLAQVPEYGWVDVPDYGWTPVTVWEERQVQVALGSELAPFEMDVGVNPDRGLTGLESYFWVDGDARGAFERTVQVSGLDPYQQGPVTVTLRFVPVRYDWAFGDGGAASVTSPGWPYDPLSAIQSDVRHTYERTSRSQPGGRYTVAVTAVFDVYYRQGNDPWRYAGRTTGSGSRAYEVQQLQTVLE